MIHLYTGNGKGKTTAAIGLAVRAAGRDFQVYFAQFMKGNDTGELPVLRNLLNVKILRSEKNFGFYNSMSDTDKKELTEIHNRILDELIRAAETGDCDMIVMDEITYPVNWKLLDSQKLERLLALCGEKKSDGSIGFAAGQSGSGEGTEAAGQSGSDEGAEAAGQTGLNEGAEEKTRKCTPPELVMTGRNAAPFLWELSDYITEMECRRHPFEKGIQARCGIEF